MEEWRRDSKKEKKLLEISEYQLLQECLTSLILSMQMYSVVGERFSFLTGVKSLSGFGAGAISFNHFQNLCILFQSSCTWQRQVFCCYSENPPFAGMRRSRLLRHCRYLSMQHTKKNPPCKIWQHPQLESNLLWIVNILHMWLFLLLSCNF